MAKRPAKKPASEVVASQKEAAEKLGITDRALRQWVKEDGFPDCSAGYDVAAIRTWREALGRKGSTVDRRVKRLKLRALREQVRIKTAEADKREREENEAKGNILNRETYELYVIECEQKARDRLLRLPKLLCRCVPKKFHATLQREADSELRKILEELVRDLEKGPDKRDLARPSKPVKKGAGD